MGLFQKLTKLAASGMGDVSVVSSPNGRAQVRRRHPSSGHPHHSHHRSSSPFTSRTKVHCVEASSTPPSQAERRKSATQTTASSQYWQNPDTHTHAAGPSHHFDSAAYGPYTGESLSHSESPTHTAYYPTNNPAGSFGQHTQATTAAWTDPFLKETNDLSDAQGTVYPETFHPETACGESEGRQPVPGPPRHDSFLQNDTNPPQSGDCTAQSTADNLPAADLPAGGQSVSDQHEPDVETGWRRFSTWTDDGALTTHFGPWDDKLRMIPVGVKPLRIRTFQGTRSDGIPVYRKVKTPRRHLVFHKAENFQTTPLGDWLTELNLKDVVDQAYSDAPSEVRTEVIHSVLDYLIPKYYHEGGCNYSIKTDERGPDVETNWNKIRLEDARQRAWWTDARYEEWTNKWLASHDIPLLKTGSCSLRAEEDHQAQTQLPTFEHGESRPQTGGAAYLTQTQRPHANGDEDHITKRYYKILI
ncbi:hypothetical protein IAT40_007703 [Kwoniella sp. CBS 6097]